MHWICHTVGKERTVEEVLESGIYSPITEYAWRILQVVLHFHVCRRKARGSWDYSALCS